MSKFFDDTMKGLLEAVAIEYKNKSEEKNEETKLKRCPICGKEVNICGGDADGIYYPYRIQCGCGLVFCIRRCDLSDFVEAWNTRKPVENVLERLSHLTNNAIDKYNNTYAGMFEHDFSDGESYAYEMAIDIINEECDEECGI